MRYGWAIQTATEEVLTTSAQLGVRDIIVYGGPGFKFKPGTTEPLKGERATYDDYLALRKLLESYGLRLAGFEGGFVTLRQFHDVVFGGPRRDELIERLLGEIRDMARAGVPVFGYHWMPNSVWRSDPVRIRGNAEATAFELGGKGSQAYGTPDAFPPGADLSRQSLWRNLEYWIKAATPAAEGAGIRLGIHPDDPPVDELGGVPRLLNGFEAYKRLTSIVDSPSNGIEFCQGTFSEMKESANGGIYEVIRYFAERKKILYVHFRNVSGTVPKFHEEFINTGYVDMYRAMKTYAEAGFDGVFMDDHCPYITNDVEFPGNIGGYRSRIFAQGYLQAMIEAVTKQRQEARAR